MLESKRVEGVWKLFEIETLLLLWEKKIEDKPSGNIGILFDNSSVGKKDGDTKNTLTKHGW